MLAETHPHHAKYTWHKAVHEAGYDSYLTARVFIRLSAKLNVDSYYEDNAPNPMASEAYFTAPEDGRVSTSSDEGSDLSLPNLQNSHGRRQHKAAKKTTKFSHAGRYDALAGLNGESPESSVSTGSPITANDIQEGEVFVMPALEDDEFWSWYRNKLRVNGTVEGVCSLDGDAYGPVYLQ